MPHCEQASELGRADGVFDITYQDACNPNNDQIETGEPDTLPRFLELAPVHEEPHETTDSICERTVSGSHGMALKWKILTSKPASKQCTLYQNGQFPSLSVFLRQTYDQAQEVIEDGNRFRNHPGNDPERQCNGNPCADREKGPFVHMLGVSEETDVDVLGADVAVDHTCNDNLGED